ncbi:MAG: hypothetical protein ACLSS0_18660 [Clostridioides difficile]
MDWMMPAIIKHKDLEILEKHNLSTSISMEDESKWYVKTWNRDDIDFEKHEKKNKRSSKYMDLSQHDTEYYDKQRKLNFEYPYWSCEKGASICNRDKKRQEEYEEQDDFV